MIKIDRIRMRLPEGFEHRATSIALLVGEALAKQSVSQDVSLEAISIRHPEVSVNTTDTEIAHMIVRQIVSNYNGSQ